MMFTCVFFACVLMQDALKKNISNYELATEYRVAANDLILNASGLQTPQKQTKKAKTAKSPKPQSDTESESEWSGSSSSDSDGSTNKKRRRRSSRKKGKKAKRGKKKTSAKKKKNKGKSPPKNAARWSRCYADPLTALLEKNLSRAFNSKLTIDDQKKAAMYPFCQRVLRLYMREWRKSGKSELHEQREKFVQLAVGVVQKHQIRPANSGPFLGNDERAVKTLLGVIESALVMPHGRAEVGSEVGHLLVSTLHVYARFCSCAYLHCRCMRTCRSG